MDYKKYGAWAILIPVISGITLEIRAQVRDVVIRVTVLETKDDSKEKRFLRYMNRIDKTLNKIESKVDKISEEIL